MAQQERKSLRNRRGSFHISSLCMEVLTVCKISVTQSAKAATDFENKKQKYKTKVNNSQPLCVQAEMKMNVKK